ncbi:flagellar motor protein MotB [Ornithinibacillus sp. L9]|uniref:Flagellar motor protein MotB n=1 Tax=Ornithinibacillus caprae TaxID=2678566 RepID=A0A6N8FM14_9BACI|nr:flagellar motor protein MotB [Ornithinibacillus caprae]MUK89037.1 flagellar motor protein MotB [Ornithinibacillus caprae]
MANRKRKKDEHHTDESWLLPYADMLTLLLALFIVLFAMSEVDTKKYEELAQFFRSEFSDGSGMLEYQENPLREMELESKQRDEANELNDMYALKAEVDQYIEGNGLTDVLSTQLSEEGLMISIMNHVTFDSGSATVKQDGIEIAAEIAKFLDTDPPRQIVISGHTDDVPIRSSEFSSNWELSVMRAVNFMDLILHNDNLDPTKFSAKGYGEHKPIAPNNNDDSREKNRRVEVLILPNYEIKIDE